MASLETILQKIGDGDLVFLEINIRRHLTRDDLKMVLENSLPKLTDVALNIPDRADKFPTLPKPEPEPEPEPTPPVAQFVGDPLTGDAPLTVQFTDQSTNTPTSWSWDFGDTNTSTQQNPQHIYQSNGSFTVTLTVSNEDGTDNEVKSNYIVVTSPAPEPEPPIANFSASPTSGTEPLSVQFTDLSSNNPTAWEWDFGDINTSTEQNPVHTYTTIGTFTVTLKAINFDGEDTETKVDFITVTTAPPVAEFVGLPLSGEVPLSVQFTDQSTGQPTSWDWTFGDTGTSIEQNPLHIYNAEGTFTVSLTVANVGGSNQKVRSNYITVNPAPTPPTANFSATPTTGTAPLTVNFTDLSSNNPTSWSWTFGDGGTSILQNPSHEYAAAGTFDISLTVSNNDGQDTETKVGFITVNAPSGQFDVVLINCAGSSFIDSQSRTWEADSDNSFFLDGATVNRGGIAIANTEDDTIYQTERFNISAYEIPIADGTYTVKLHFAETFSGITAAGQRVFDVAVEDQAVIDLDIFAESGGNNIALIKTFNSVSVVGNLLNIVFTEKVQNSLINGIEVLSTNPPVPITEFVGSPLTGDAPLTVNFSDQSLNLPDTFSWDFGDGSALSTEVNPSHTYNAGTFTVALTTTNEHGSDTETKVDYIAVTQPPPAETPVADFTADITTGDAPLTVNFTDLSTNTPTAWSWDFGDGTTSTQQHPQHTYNLAGTYDVTLEAFNSGGSDIETKIGFVTVATSQVGLNFIPTFESCGIYWDTGTIFPRVGVRFRKSGNINWINGIDMFDARLTSPSPDDQYRSSIVHLEPATAYEVEIMPEGGQTVSGTFSTWREVVDLPIAQTITLPASSTSTLNIIQSGSSSGYILYEPAGASAVININNETNDCVNIDAKFIILRNLTLQGGKFGVNLSQNTSDIIIDNCDISGWGRGGDVANGWGKTDGAIDARTVNDQPNLKRIVVQRCHIHEPRWDTNSWREFNNDSNTNHPTGPQCIEFNNPGGNNVFRYNQFDSTDNKKYNDIIGGFRNFSDRGFPGPDSDVYGNFASHALDDAFEIEGGGMNVRVWGNYLDLGVSKIAFSVCSKGPLYIWRNVYDRGTFGSNEFGLGYTYKGASANRAGSFYGWGQVHIYHSTQLQRNGNQGHQHGVRISFNGSNPRNVIVRNNVLYNRSEVYRDANNSCTNSLDFDLWNGTFANNCSSNPHEQNGINGIPEFNTGTNVFSLVAGTLGHNAGIIIPNFTNKFNGPAPDMGAHEEGDPAMQFGRTAYIGTIWGGP